MNEKEKIIIYKQKIKKQWKKIKNIMNNNLIINQIKTFIINYYKLYKKRIVKK